MVSGHAEAIEDAGSRKAAAEKASYVPAERYVLFELSVERASSTVYDDEGRAIRQHWP